VNRKNKQKVEQEFLCSIRPAEASFPYSCSKDNDPFSFLLSTASMIAYDFESQTLTCNQDSSNTSKLKEESFQESEDVNKIRSRHSYGNDGEEPCSESSYGTGNKNTTSSETCSEDEADQEYQEKIV
jgi:hypothetical protein